jgi:hypothetical protein
MIAMLGAAGGTVATVAGAAVVMIKSSVGLGRHVQKQEHHHDMLSEINRKLDTLPKIERDCEQAKNFGAANAKHIAHIYKELSLRPPAPSHVDLNGDGGEDKEQ